MLKITVLRSPSVELNGVPLSFPFKRADALLSYMAVQKSATRQELAALLFLSALARALYLPQPGNRKALCAAGLAAFVLCLCWQLPQTLLLMTGLGWASPAVWPYLLADAGLCCIGGIGAVCAKSCADGQT